jgi:hypothetical protein
VLVLRLAGEHPREIFAEFPDTFVNIDLKGADPDGVLLAKVMALIVSHKRCVLFPRAPVPSLSR